MTVQEWVDAYAQAWRDRDADAAAALFTEDSMYRDHPLQEGRHGAAGVHAYWVDVTASQPHLYVASAAGNAAAGLLRTTYTTVVQQQTADTLADLAKGDDTMKVSQAQDLNTPPAITDVVPLPSDDVNGVSLGFLTQALALGGTIASMGLGRLIPRAPRSWRRGLAHVTILIVYAVGSAAVILWSMTWFGVGETADRGEMLGIFSLISLAITASTAGAVALFGPAGALIGAMYFTLGTVISGASILPGQMKGMKEAEVANFELYDLQADPGETRDRSGDEARTPVDVRRIPSNTRQRFLSKTIS